MEPVNLNKSEPANVGPVQTGRPKRARKPKRQRTPKEAAGSPDSLLTISVILIAVILLIGGTVTIRSFIDSAEHLCSQANSGHCSGPGLSTGYDVPIFP